jgi:hypothetical protein
MSRTLQAQVLMRPEQHIAWRGDSIPQDPLVLVGLVRGGGPPTE